MPKSRLRVISAFTLIELLIAITLLGILATIGMGTFKNSQMRSRDTQRKANLKQVANALELYYSDYGKYPNAANGNIESCGISWNSSCVWGQDEFTDGKTVYFKKLPKDPTASLAYFYKLVSLSNNQKYQLFARLENLQDQDCINGVCDPGIASGFPNCGEKICNFSITSSNTSALE